MILMNGLISIILCLICASISIGCTDTKEDIVTPFAASWEDEGRAISLSGFNQRYKAGSQTEVLLMFENIMSDEPWESEYIISFVLNTGGDKEVVYHEFEIPPGQTLQTPITVVFPEKYEGLIGLKVAINRFNGVFTAWIQLD